MPERRPIFLSKSLEENYLQRSIEPRTESVQKTQVHRMIENHQVSGGPGGKRNYDVWVEISLENRGVCWGWEMRHINSTL